MSPDSAQRQCCDSHAGVTVPEAPGIWRNVCLWLWMKNLESHTYGEDIKARTEANGLVVAHDA